MTFEEINAEFEKLGPQSMWDWDAPEEKPMTGPQIYYTEKVIDHFQNPRNVGSLPPEETSGYAKVGDAGCGDEMELWFHIADGRIDKIRFKSFGCPGAISTSSMLTVLADGKTLEEAKAITDDDVVNALDGIPENKKHCSLLGVQALQAAISMFDISNFS